MNHNFYTIKFIISLIYIFLIFNYITVVISITFPFKVDSTTQNDNFIKKSVNNSIPDDENLNSMLADKLVTEFKNIFKDFFTVALSSVLNKTHNNNKILNNTSVLNFSRSIYMHNENNNEHKNLYLSEYDKRAYKESDVIISVIGEKIINNRHINNYYGEMMYFNVTKVRDNRTLQFADLKLFKKSYKTQNYKNDKNNNNFIEDNCDFYYIKVHELRKSKNLNHHLVTESVVNKNYEGWVTLNISSLFDKWSRHPEKNNGIYVNVFPMNDYCENKNLTLRDIGIVNIESEHKRDMDPFIVGYLKTSYEIDDNDNGLHDDSDNEFRLKRDLRRLIVDKSYHAPKVRKHVGHYGSCQVRPFTISFSDFGWADFIIAPIEYKLSFCAGDCSLSSFITERDTMHSYLQLLAHSAYPDRVPIPCCAAKKFEPMNILYYGDNQNIVLEKMKRIAVTSCQCL